jgi:hypothetical protein
MNCPRAKVIGVGGTLVAAICIIGIWLCRRDIAIAYHRFAMNAAYDEIFGNPQPLGNGFASFDVTDVDVDAVMERYARHRNELVKHGYFFVLKQSLPELAVTSDQKSHLERSAFVQRMWRRVPHHKHYYLSPAGIFEVYDILENKRKWELFLASEPTATEVNATGLTSHCRTNG